MKLVRPFSFTLLLLSFIWHNSTQAYLAINKSSPPLKSFREISSLCKTSPFDCLTHVDLVLEHTPKNSRLHFEILQYKFEALFNLQQVEELYQQTQVWLKQENLPFLFQITNAIYFAKAAIVMGDLPASLEQYQVAKSMLEQMNQQYPSPIRLVQFANLQMQLNQHQEAYQLLSELAQKLQKSPDVYFMLELHGNLGHAANHLGDLPSALKHWQDTTHWAALYGNQQQAAVVEFNLADIYAQLADYQNASSHFTKAISLALQAGDQVKANQARFHLIQVYLAQQAFCQAQAVFAELDSSQLPASALYQVQLAPQITGCD